MSTCFKLSPYCQTSTAILSIHLQQIEQTFTIIARLSSASFGFSVAHCDCNRNKIQQNKWENSSFFIKSLVILPFCQIPTFSSSFLVGKGFTLCVRRLSTIAQDKRGKPFFYILVFAYPMEKYTQK